jgi:hypothetical protein
VADDGTVHGILEGSGLHPTFGPKLARRGVKLPATLMGSSGDIANVAGRMGLR